MMNMMKKLYQDGDDQTKQMIAKAWTENQDKKGKIRGAGAGKGMPGMPGMGGMPGMPPMM